jgi:hypothetical protein
VLLVVVACEPREDFELVQREAVAFIELAAERAVVAGIAALGLLVALGGVLRGGAVADADVEEDQPKLTPEQAEVAVAAAEFGL